MQSGMILDRLNAIEKEIEATRDEYRKNRDLMMQKIDLIQKNDKELLKSMSKKDYLYLLMDEYTRIRPCCSRFEKLSISKFISFLQKSISDIEMSERKKNGRC